MSKHIIHLAIMFSFMMNVSSLYSMDQLQLDDYNPALTLWFLKKPIVTLFTHDRKKIVIYDEQQEVIQHTIQLKHNSFNPHYSPDENFLTFAFCDADNSNDVQHCIFDIRSGTQTKLPTFPGETFISSTCFHPTNHILAAHIYPEDVIQYWDIEQYKWLTQHGTIVTNNIPKEPTLVVWDKVTEKILTYYDPNAPRVPTLGLWNKITEKILTYHELLQLFKHRLSFTPDGKSIDLDWTVKTIKKDVVAKQARLIVPFETIGKNTYMLDTKNKLFSLFCLLKCCRYGDQPLSPKIIKLLMRSMLKISEL